MELTLDPASKKISLVGPSSDSLDKQLAALNELSRQLVTLPAEVPPPPNNLSRFFSDQVTKLKDSAATATKKSKHDEAIKHLNIALEFALKRPLWEAAGFVLDEVSSILGPRCDAFMAQNRWPEAYDDASLLALFNPSDPKNQYRRGKCLEAIYNFDEARAVYETGLALTPGNVDLKRALSSLPN